MILPTVALTRFAPARNIQHVYKQKKTETSRYGFKIGQLGLLLCLQEKIEIVDSIDPCPIPNTPQWFAGMINLRGNLLPVFDMKELLGMDKAGTENWIMIYGKGSRTAGIYIDKLPVAIQVEQKIEEQPVLPDLLKGYIRNLYGSADSDWIEMDFERLFSDLHAHF